jgi:hypothetical protein
MVPHMLIETTETKSFLFDHPVCDGEERGRHSEHLGACQIDDQIELSRLRRASSPFQETRGTLPPRMLFLITQQFSLLVPDLQAVPADYVIIWTQRFGGFERQFERLKRLHGMTAVGRDAKRSVYVMTLSGFSEKSA